MAIICNLLNLLKTQLLHVALSTSTLKHIRQPDPGILEVNYFRLLVVYNLHISQNLKIFTRNKTFIDRIWKIINNFLVIIILTKNQVKKAPWTNKYSHLLNDKPDSVISTHHHWKQHCIIDISSNKMEIILFEKSSSSFKKLKHLEKKNIWKRKTFSSFTHWGQFRLNQQLAWK